VDGIGVKATDAAMPHLNTLDGGDRGHVVGGGGVASCGIEGITRVYLFPSRTKPRLPFDKSQWEFSAERIPGNSEEATPSSAMGPGGMWSDHTIHSDIRKWEPCFDA
jgi:hypothetical protein